MPQHHNPSKSTNTKENTYFVIVGVLSFTELLIFYTSHVMRKPVYAICKQQRRRSACASAKSDQCLCCSLSGEYETSTCYSRNFKTLASLTSWAGHSESYLVTNPEDRFFRDVAHIYMRLNMFGVLYDLVNKELGQRSLSKQWKQLSDPGLLCLPFLLQHLDTFL